MISHLFPTLTSTVGAVDMCESCRSSAKWMLLTCTPKRPCQRPSGYLQSTGMETVMLTWFGDVTLYPVLGHLYSWRENSISACAPMSILVFCWGVASAAEIERHSRVQEFMPQLGSETYRPCLIQQRKGLNPALVKMNPNHW